MTGLWAVLLVSSVAVIGCSADPTALPSPSASSASATAKTSSSPTSNGPTSSGAAPSAVQPSTNASSPATASPGTASPGTANPSTANPSARATAAPAANPGATAPSPTKNANPPLAPAVAPFTGTTASTVKEPTGGPFGVKVARVAGQSGYDRVVIELAGRATGAPGWRVDYVATPTSDGSGNPIAMKGRYFLHVGVQGVGYPADTGVPNPAVRRIAPTGTTVIQEFVLDSVYEGVYTTYVGLSAKRPYRVFALSNPARIVVDIRHS